MESILVPFYWFVSWVLIGWHNLLSLVGVPRDSGLNWALAIVGLVVVIRAVLMPLFVKQIKASRQMQLIQPQVRALQAKYKDDKELLNQELMKLYKDTNTNPFASCMPLLVQMPFFFALFRTLNGIATNVPHGAFSTHAQAFASAQDATLFGASLSQSFVTADNTAGKVLAMVFVLGMTASTFYTQKQLISKNMPKEALEGPFAQQQKVMLYVMPFMFLFSGFTFPLGVVLYWFTSNLWTAGQQFYVIRAMPAPGSEAERQRIERAARKGVVLETARLERSGAAPVVVDGTATVSPGVQRQQPKRTSRRDRRGR